MGKIIWTILLLGLVSYGSDGLSCYEGITSTSDRITSNKDAVLRECGEGVDRCYVAKLVVNIYGIKMEMVVSGCADSEGMCNAASSCDGATFELPNEVERKSCELVCCNEDECNEPTTEQFGNVKNGKWSTSTLSPETMPVKAGWSLWKKMAKCSAKCGGGLQRFSRKCVGGSWKKECIGPRISKDFCNTQPCDNATEGPIGGATWSEWKTLKKCSATCGGGITRLTRKCIGGRWKKDCRGVKILDKICNNHPCEDDPITVVSTEPPQARWSVWSDWSSCSASCGGGTMSRKRSCIGGKRGRKGCMGLLTMKKKCNAEKCKPTRTCYVGDSSAGDIQVQTCPNYDDHCYVVQIEVDTSGVLMTVGEHQCMTESFCNQMTCDSVTKNMMGSARGISIVSCKQACCQGDNCNTLESIALVESYTSATLEESILSTTPTTQKATVTTVTQSVITSTKVATTLAEAGGLTCYNGTDLPLYGMRMTEVVCGSNELCHYTKMNVTAIGMQIKVGIGQCIAEETCSAMTCDDIKAGLSEGMSGMASQFGGCKLRCCSENLCNDNLGEQMLPSVAPSVTVQQPRVTCYVGNDLPQMGMSMETVSCAEGSICHYTMLNIVMMGMALEIGVGQCVLKAACSHVKCDEIENGIMSSMQGMAGSVSNCRLFCCEENLCNTRQNLPETTAVTSPPSPSTATEITTPAPRISCYTGNDHPAMGMYMETMLCSEGSICHYTTVKVVVIGMPLEIGVGQCVSKIACQHVKCDAMKSGLMTAMPGMISSITDCNLFCCEKDFCNTRQNLPSASSSTSATPEVPPTHLASTIPATTMETSPAEPQVTCYTGSGYPIETPMNETLCHPGTICHYMLVTFEAEGTTMQSATGQCVLKSVCPEINCQDIEENVMKMGDTITSVSDCKFLCCEEDLCNTKERLLQQVLPNVSLANTTSPPTTTEPISIPEVTTEATTESTTALATPAVANGSASAGGPIISCYSGTDMSFLNLKMAEVACSAGDICHYSKLKVTLIGRDMDVGLGQCVPESECSSITCEDVQSGLDARSSIAGSRVKSCSVMCCNEDLCNTEQTLVEAMANQTNVVEPPTYTPMYTPPQTTQSTISAVSCYTGADMPMFGMAMERQTCNPGEVCLYSNMDVQMFGSGTMGPDPISSAKFGYGQCVPETDCQVMTCTSMAAQIPPGLSLAGCTIMCCTTDLCNTEQGLADALATSSPAVVTTTPALPTALTCYNGTDEETSGLKMNKIECPEDYVCHIAKLDVMGGADQKTTLKMGQCLPKNMCIDAACKRLMGTIPQVVECSEICCNTSLCNDDIRPMTLT